MEIDQILTKDQLTKFHTDPVFRAAVYSVINAKDQYQVIPLIEELTDKLQNQNQIIEDLVEVTSTLKKEYNEEKTTLFLSARCRGSRITSGPLTIEKSGLDKELVEGFIVKQFIQDAVAGKQVKKSGLS